MSVRLCGVLAALLIALQLGLLAAPAVAGDFEQALLARINSYRASHKLKPLSPSAPLDELAREHSRNMGQEDRLSHDGFQERFQRSHSMACVENVGWNHQTAADQFSGWKNSSGHNRNMLDSQVTRAGIAKVGPYVTFFACK